MTTSERTHKKKLTTMACRVLHRLGIMDFTKKDGPSNVDVERLLSVSDEELMATQGCGEKVLERIHKIQEMYRLWKEFHKKDCWLVCTYDLARTNVLDRRGFTRRPTKWEWVRFFLKDYRKLSNRRGSFLNFVKMVFAILWHAPLKASQASSEYEYETNSELSMG